MKLPQLAGWPVAESWHLQPPESWDQLCLAWPAGCPPAAVGTPAPGCLAKPPEGYRALGALSNCGLSLALVTPPLWPYPHSLHSMTSPKRGTFGVGLPCGTLPIQTALAALSPALET